MKTELKQLALNIRSLKSQRKLPENRGYVQGLSTAQYHFRHKHIAYCLLRGRSYEQIEKKVAEGNEPNWEYINELKSLYLSAEKAA